VTVDGTAYDVTVEEADDGAAAPVPEAARPAAAAPRHAQVAVPARPAAAEARRHETGQLEVTAPLPGAVLAVRVGVGDSVVEGQVLCLLEAMKMENEIVAPGAGTVREVAVQAGQSVAAGEVLLRIEP
jgi:biotin carboxyl carrier protein